MHLDVSSFGCKSFMPSPLQYYDESKSINCSVVSDFVTHGCSPPGSSVHGILQARILEWIAGPSSRRSSQSRDRTQVSRIAGRFFTSLATREVLQYLKIINCFIFKSYYQFFKSIKMTSLFEKKKPTIIKAFFEEKSVFKTFKKCV